MNTPNARLTIARMWRTVLLATATLLTSYLLAQLPTYPPNGDYTGLFAIWVTAIAAYVIAITQPWTMNRHNWKEWWQVHRHATLALSAVTVIALGLRVWQIGSVPFVLNGDEAAFGIEAARGVRGELSNPFATGHHTQPTLSFFFGGLAIPWLGLTQEAIRLPWAFLGTLTVPITFWLATRLKGIYVGFVTAALLATYHFHIHYSRLNLNNIADPFWGGLALLFLYRALSRNSLMDWAFAGAACGGALYFYQGARLVPLVVLTSVAYIMLLDNKPLGRDRWLGLVSALGAFLIVAAPILEYAFHFPAEFNGRIDAASIIQSGWLMRAAAETGQNPAAIFLDQVQRAGLAFNVYPDTSVFYDLGQPLLDPIFGAFFLLGLIYGTARVFTPNPDKRLVPLVAWWWSGAIVGGALTLGTPASQRLITLAVPVCFFAALGMWQLSRLMQRAGLRQPARAVLIAGVLLFSGISLKTYFVDYTPKHIAGGPGAEVATALAWQLQDQAASHQIYFFGAPFLFWGFPTFDFFFPNVDAVDVVEPLTAPPPASWVPPDKGGIFIFLSGRLKEMELIRQTFPRGETQVLRTPRDGSIMATIYRVPTPNQK